MVEFEAIETGIITAIDALKTSHGVREIDSYAGQLEAQSIEAITRRFPAVYVVVSGLDNQVENKIDKFAASIDVIVADKNLRSLKTARTADNGVYAVMSEIITKLHRQRIVATGWTPPMLTKAAPVAYHEDRHLCVYALRFEMRKLG